MLKANGKFIDTLPLQHLLSLGEHHSDVITIEIDSVYENLDLSEFTFVMRGITASGTEVQTTLSKIAPDDENYLWLVWNISNDFTSEDGTLFLDLYAYYYNSNTNQNENPPDYLLRYQLPPIEIRSLPAVASD